jgi:signal transduction histidine kinase
LALLRSIRLRWIVAALVLAIVAPLGILAALSMQRVWRRQLANVERQNVATVRAISVAIDQQIERTTSALDVLGELHALDTPDLPAFESLAARMLPYQPTWSGILLADRDGRVIDGVPNRNDAGATKQGKIWPRAVLEAGRTIVSDMFTLDGATDWHVMVAVPVVRDGQVVRILAARVRTSSLSDTLRQQQAPPDGAVALVGGDYRILARTQQEEGIVGTLANKAFIEENQRTAEGSFRPLGRDGNLNYSAFSRSAKTGLTAALGIPANQVDGPIRRILWTLAGAWLVVLGLGAVLGALLGNVIVRALSSASDAAMQLARGGVVSPPPSRIAEIDALASALRQASDTLEARNRERNEASRLKDEFLMTISHELRTPLTAICGWARLMSANQMREEQKPRAIEAIERNANALQQLVDDLLDVSRIVSGKLRLDVQELNLTDVVSSAIDAIRPAADAKNIQLVVEADPRAALVSGDAGRLQQIVWNLLSNAVKFTPAGGRIEIASRREADMVQLTVKDSGVGMEPDFLPHAFDRFRQGKSGTTRAHGGLGLGLSIVRHLVELHGGTVTGANNVPPPGATFKVLLPCRAAAVAMYPGAAAPRETSVASTTLPTTAAS